MRHWITSFRFRCRDPSYSASIAIRKCDTSGLVAGRELRKNRPSPHGADIESKWRHSHAAVDVKRGAEVIEKAGIETH